MVFIYIFNFSFSFHFFSFSLFSFLSESSSSDRCMSAQRSEQRRQHRDHDVHNPLDRLLRTFLHSITPPFCNYLSFLLILTKTLKTPLCVCGLRPLCFSREPASESELSSRSQDNHRFVPNHRPPSAKTPFAPLTEKQPVRRLTP